MNKMKQTFQMMIQHFLKEALHSVKMANSGLEKIPPKNLNNLADSILELHKTSIKLIKDNTDESIAYNATLVRQCFEAPLELTTPNKEQLSLVQAANLTKKAHQEPLRHLVEALALESSLREVFFTDLQQISEELAA